MPKNSFCHFSEMRANGVYINRALCTAAVCAVLAALTPGCSREDTMPETPKQSGASNLADNDLTVPFTASSLDLEQFTIALPNDDTSIVIPEKRLEPVRTLVKQLLQMAVDDRISKPEIDRLMETLPNGGSIGGMGDILCVLVKSDNVADRLDALTLLAAVRRQWSAEPHNEADPSVDNAGEFETADSATDVVAQDVLTEQAAPTTNQDSVQDLESALVMQIMTSCLSDSDDAVRLTALGTMLTLPSEERDALSLQVLGNEDASLKLTLLSESNDPQLESDITLNFHGLDSDDERVKQLASDNLTSMIGMTFESSDAAFEWWEANNQSLMQ